MSVTKRTLAGIVTGMLLLLGGSFATLGPAAAAAPSPTTTAVASNIIW